MNADQRLSLRIKTWPGRIASHGGVMQKGASEMWGVDGGTWVARHLPGTGCIRNRVGLSDYGWMKGVLPYFRERE